MFELKKILIISTDGRIIPSGASINLLISNIHLNEKFYPEPYNWNPDNFCPDLVASRHPYSFIPFGGGPRICVGKKFSEGADRLTFRLAVTNFHDIPGYKYAILAAKAEISAILRSFTLSTNLRMTELDVRLTIMFRSKNGYPVMLKRRNAPSLQRKGL